MDNVLWHATYCQEEQLISFLKTYNHRTRPIEGDLVEVACRHGMINVLDFLLEEEHEILKQKHMSAAIVYSFGHQTRSVRMVRHLVRLGLKVNSSHLRYAVSHGNITMVRTLVKSGANVNGITMVLCKDAPTKKIIPMMKVLLTNGADERLGKLSIVSIGSRASLQEAKALSTSVENWRQRKNFSLVSKGFLEVFIMMKVMKNVKVMKVMKVMKKKMKVMKNEMFLELNGDILAEVYSFLV